ncbi:MAG TPA: hypothetical protein VEK33_10630 [Terriglobales bacterium]|nr:hypothetical protein [Terriglobales bacterium]
MTWEQISRLLVMPDSKPYCEYLGDALDAAACDNPVTKMIHLRIGGQDEVFFCCSAHAGAFIEEEAERYERMEDYRPDPSDQSCEDSLRVRLDLSSPLVGKLLRNAQTRVKYKAADVIRKKAIPKKTLDN